MALSRLLFRASPPAPVPIIRMQRRMHRGSVAHAKPVSPAALDLQGRGARRGGNGPLFNEPSIIQTLPYLLTRHRRNQAALDGGPDNRGKKRPQELQVETAGID